MPRTVDDVEISEPPIQKLNNNRSCLRQSCTTGCFGIIILGIVLFLGIRYAAAPRVKVLNAVPDTIPKDIPIYDTREIETITFLSGRDRSRTTEIVGIIPKVILAPIYISAERYLPEEMKNIFPKIENETGWQRLSRVVRQPLFTGNDLVEITWTHLAAQPDFLKEYYEKELKKNGYIVTLVLVNQKIEEVRFENETGTIHGVFVTNDISKERGTDEARLSISLGGPFGTTSTSTATATTTQ